MKKEIFCANIIPSDCDSVRKKEFKNVLRFSYVGDINSQKTYTQEVVAKVKNTAIIMDIHYKNASMKCIIYLKLPMDNRRIISICIF